MHGMLWLFNSCVMVLVGVVIIEDHILQQGLELFGPVIDPAAADDDAPAPPQQGLARYPLPVPCMELPYVVSLLPVAPTMLSIRLCFF